MIDYLNFLGIENGHFNFVMSSNNNEITLKFQKLKSIMSKFRTNSVVLFIKKNNGQQRILVYS